MTLAANRATTVLSAVAMTLIGTTANAQVPTTYVPNLTSQACDLTDGVGPMYWDLGLEREVDLYVACIDAGLPIVSRSFCCDLMAALTPIGFGPINLRPRMAGDSVELFRLPSYRASRVLYDLICQRNAELFRTIYLGSRCPLPTVFDITEADAINIAFNPFSGTNYAVDYLPNPLIVGPGEAGAIRFHSNNDGPSSVLQSITITEIVAERVILTDMIVYGDVTIDRSDAASVYVANSIILGDLRVAGRSIDDLRLSELWIGGDLLIEDLVLGELSLTNMRIAGDIIITGNIFSARTDDQFDFISDIDVSGQVVLDDNRVQQVADQEAVGLLLRRLLEEKETADRIRADRF